MEGGDTILLAALVWLADPINLIIVLALCFVFIAASLFVVLRLIRRRSAQTVRVSPTLADEIVSRSEASEVGEFQRTEPIEPASPQPPPRPDEDPQQAAIREAVDELERIVAGFPSLQPRVDRLTANLKDASMIDATLEEFSNLLGEVAKFESNRAAEHYRAQGAIAYFKNTETALAAYRKAATLDPEHIATWIHIGRLEWQAGRLGQAEEAFKIALRLTEASDNKIDRAGINIDLGDIQIARGSINAALELYQRASQIYHALAAENPTDLPRFRDLFVCVNKVGEVRVAQGDLNGAMDAFEKSLAIARRLASADPDNVEWQRDLSVSWEKLGDVLRDLGTVDLALDYYERSLANWQDLAARDPLDTDWQRGQTVPLNRIGDMRVAGGDFDGALDAFERALSIRERLAAADPKNAEWRRDLSVSWNKIGSVLQAEGDLEGALNAFQRGLTIRERLASTDRYNAGWQRDLLVSWNNMGDLRAATGDPAGALEAFQQSHAIAERLAEADPQNATWQRDLMISDVKLAMLFREFPKRRDAASRHVKAALSVARDLAATGRLAPTDTWMIADLESHLARLSDANSPAGLIDGPSGS